MVQRMGTRSQRVAGHAAVIAQRVVIGGVARAGTRRRCDTCTGPREQARAGSTVHMR